MDLDKKREMSAREMNRNDIVRQKTQGNQGNVTLQSNTHQESSDMFVAGPGLARSLEELVVDR